MENQASNDLIVFDMSSIKPLYDVLVWISEGDDNRFWMEFSKKELKLSVYAELKLKSFDLIDMPVNNALWIRPPAGIDKIKTTERICTTLEIKCYKAVRKIVQKNKLLVDTVPIQSFILG